MTTHRASLHALLIAGIATAAHGCGVGDVSGPGDGTGEGTGGGDGDGGGSGDGDGDGSADVDASTGALPCATEYTVTGSVDHAQEAGGSCDGSGGWGVILGAPVADSDSVACSDAPSGASFGFAVTPAGNGYAAQENGGTGGAWTVQIRDQSGGCQATFVGDAGDGASWSIIASEGGPGGPIGGAARFERRGP